MLALHFLITIEPHMEKIQIKTAIDFLLNNISEFPDKVNI